MYHSKSDQAGFWQWVGLCRSLWSSRTPASPQSKSSHSGQCGRHQIALVFFKELRGRADRDRTPRTQRRCGMVDGRRARGCTTRGPFPTGTSDRIKATAIAMASLTAGSGRVDRKQRERGARRRTGARPRARRSNARQKDTIFCGCGESSEVHARKSRPLTGN